MIVESDSLSVVNCGQKNVAGCAYAGLLLEDIKNVCSYFSSFSLSHVRRGGNTIADFMARIVSSTGSECIFVGNYPQNILSILNKT